MDTAVKKKKSKPRGRDEVKRALIDASIGLFSERGIKAVTIRDIADSAGVNLSLIYRHFGDKEALLDATVAELGLRMQPPEPAESDNGHDVLQASYQVIREHPEVFRIFGYLALEGHSDKFTALKNPAIDRVVSIIEASQRRGDVNPDIDASLMLANSYALGLGWLVFWPLLAELAGLDKAAGRKGLGDGVEQLWANAISPRHMDKN